MANLGSRYLKGTTMSASGDEVIDLGISKGPLDMSPMRVASRLLGSTRVAEKTTCLSAGFENRA